MSGGSSIIQSMFDDASQFTSPRSTRLITYDGTAAIDLGNVNFHGISDPSDYMVNLQGTINFTESTGNPGSYQFLQSQEDTPLSLIKNISSANEQEDYQTALNLIQQFYTSYPEDGQVGSIAGFEVGCRMGMGQTYPEIESALTAVPLGADNYAVRQSRQMMIAFCMVGDQRYDDAIATLEHLVHSSESTVDSLDLLAEIEDIRIIQLQNVEEGNEDGAQQKSGSDATRYILVKKHEDLRNDYSAQAEALREVADQQKQVVLPKQFELGNAYPNPFNSEVIVPFSLPSMAKVKITVYNILGRQVKIIANKKYNAGKQTVIWDGKDVASNMTASGVYFIVMRNEKGIVGSKKVVLLH